MTFNAQQFSSLTINGVDLVAQSHLYPSSSSYWVKKEGFHNPQEDFLNIDNKPFVVFSQVIGMKGMHYKVTNGSRIEYRDDINAAALIAGEMAA